MSGALAFSSAASLLLLPHGALYRRPLANNGSFSSGIFCCEAKRPADASDGSPPTEIPAGASEGDQKKTFSDNWSGAGRFADEDTLPLSFWLLGPAPRRAILPGLVAALVAPAVNLYGSGSLLLSLVPELARDKRLDTFYPVSTIPGYPYNTGGLDYGPGFQRYYSDEYRFEFRYPATYVQDQSVYLRNADRAYTQRTMDPTLAATPSTQRPRRVASGPIVALGPAGGTGDENLSVVIGALQPGFSLRGTLGEPEEGAQRLIQATIAKPGVRECTLLAATIRESARSRRPLYQFEYRVDYPGLAGKEPTYTICVVGSRDDVLYTFASRVPAVVWAQRSADLREAASSFVLL